MVKKIKSIICCVCASLVLIVAFCLPFAFDLNTKFTNYASADEVISGSTSFSGSTYCVSISGGYLVTTNAGQNSYEYNGSANMRFDYSFVNSSTIKVTITISDITFRYRNMIPGYGSHSYSGPFVGTYTCTLGSTGSSYVRFDLDSNSAIYITFDYVCTSAFNLNLISFKIDTTSSDSSRWTNFVYSDNSNGSFTFAIKNDNSNWNFDWSSSFISYSTRTYYLTTALSDNQYYQSGYSDGSSSGYSLGYSEGNTAGYNAGYTAGDSVGYNRGYDVGVNTTNTYSFTNLISAVLDAPINAFTSLFNFEILGVNLSSFLLALFTIAVVLTVVKIIF